jgi:hypothetical protein
MAEPFDDHRRFLQKIVDSFNDEARAHGRADVQLRLVECDTLHLVPRYAGSRIEYSRRALLLFFLYAFSGGDRSPLYLDYLFAVKLLERNYYDPAEEKIRTLRVQFFDAISSVPPDRISAIVESANYQCLFAIMHEFFHFAFERNPGLRAKTEEDLRAAIRDVYLPVFSRTLQGRAAALLTRMLKQNIADEWNHILGSAYQMEELACDDRAFFVGVDALASAGASPDELYSFCLGSYLATYCLETISLFDDVTSKKKGEYSLRDDKAEYAEVKHRSMFGSLRTGIVGDISLRHVRRRMPSVYAHRYRTDIRGMANYGDTLTSLVRLFANFDESFHFESTNPRPERTQRVRKVLEDLEDQMIGALGR